MSDSPFGRQPKPVKVTLSGEWQDIDTYCTLIKRYIEGRGDNVEIIHGNIFTIFPRAVND